VGGGQGADGLAGLGRWMDGLFGCCKYFCGSNKLFFELFRDFDIL
jgi:hypothetical protein